MRGDPCAELGVDRAVEDDHTAERGHRVGCERQLPRLVDRRRNGDPARVPVLDDHGCRIVELLADAPGALEVGEIVVRELLAAELLDPREQMLAPGRLDVERRRLMGVLAVREVGDFAKRQCQLGGEGLVAAEPVGDRSFVRGTRRERLAREAPPGRRRHRAVRAQLVEHEPVLRGRRDRGDMREVLRSRPQHRRAADVDQLDDLLFGPVAPRCRRRERVQVDADQVDRLDSLLGEHLEVLGQVTPGQDACMDCRMERLDASAEQLGRPRHLLDGRHGDPLLGQDGRRPARGDDLPAELGETAREVVDAVLVPDADQRTRQSSLTTSGRSRCSTAWIRSTSVARGSTASSSCTITGPESRPSST